MGEKGEEKMMRTVSGAVMWVGRATVFLVGLAVMLAVIFGVATAALAGTGVGAVFNLGQVNTVDRVSQLVGSANTPMLRVDNNGTGPALDLRVGTSATPPTQETVAPMKVDSQAKVTNLNADELDGLGADELAPRGYAQVTPSVSGFLEPGRSKGVNGVVRTTPSSGSTTQSVYCFDLTFTPHAAVTSPFINNNAVVATVTPPNPALNNLCPAPHNDAAARTFAANTSADHDDIGFAIAFM